MKQRHGGSLAVILSLVTCAAAQAQGISNGSFEQPAIADGSIQLISPTGWLGGAALLNPNAGGGIAGNPFAWPQAAEGQQYADIGNTPAFAMSQSFAVAAAGSYQLAWADHTGLNIQPGFQMAPFSVELRDDGGALVYEAQLDSWHANGAWLQRSVQLDLLPGTFTLTFSSQNQVNGTDTLIDAVSVSVVPEPVPLLLLLLGLPWVAARARRARPRCA